MAVSITGSYIFENVIHFIVFVVFFRLVTINVFYNPSKIHPTTKVSLTKQPSGRHDLLIWMSTYTTWIKSNANGCTLNLSLGVGRYHANKTGSKGWMMISGNWNLNIFDLLSKEKIWTVIKLFNPILFSYYLVVPIIIINPFRLFYKSLHEILYVLFL